MEQKTTKWQYFTDREYGEQPRTVEVVNGRVWGGLCSLVDKGVSDGSFGYRFPEQCPDGRGPCGCDSYAFSQMLRAEIPTIDWPLSAENLPETPVILDLLEFCAQAVGEPIERDYHSFFGHSHLSWDRKAGLAMFVANVNRLFARNGVGFALNEEGRAQRLLPEELEAPVREAVFRTGDAETDRLLELARKRIMSPKPEDRQDSLEKLWDAFERTKTLEAGTNKRLQAEALLDRVANPGTEFRRLLGEEARALTEIGNNFRIRHSEVTQEPVGSLEHVDYLFGRLFSFMSMVLKATGRGS